MRGENFLLALSRIALTFVGFASIVSLIRHGRSEWLPQEVRGLKLIVEFGLALTLLALLPFPLAYSFGERWAWRIAVAILAIYYANALWRHYRAYTRTSAPLGILNCSVGHSCCRCSC